MKHQVCKQNYMRKKTCWFLAGIIVVMFSFSGRTSEAKEIPAFPFKDEMLVYQIKWNDIPIGKATFICTEEVKNHKPAYHFTLFTQPAGMIANRGLGFYRLETWTDKKTLKPIYYYEFLRNGPRKIISTAVYDMKNHTVKWRVTKYKEGVLRSNETRVNPIPSEIYDALTAFYVLRTKQFVVGKGLGAPVNTDEDIIKVYLQVLETQKNNDSVLGNIDTFKVATAAKTSQGFRQEKVQVWFTTNKSKIPVHFFCKTPFGPGTMSLISITKASTQNRKAK